MKRVWRWLAGGLIALLLVFGLALAVVDTDVGHRWVAQRIGAIRTANGLRFAVGRIDGSLYGAARLRDVRVYDLDGLLLQAPAVQLDWRPWRWARNTLDIRTMAVPQAVLLHAPHTRPSGRSGPLLPDFDIRIGRLAIDRLVLARPVLGSVRVASLVARADVRRGRAMLVADGAVAGSDRLALRLDAEPDRDRFDLMVKAEGRTGGVLARAIGRGRPVAMVIDGRGSWSRWHGRALARANGTPIADLALTAQSGRYRLNGMAAPAPLLTGKAQRLTQPRIALDGAATFVDRRLAGTVAMRSAALSAQAEGTVDFAANRWQAVRIRARLLRPAALFPNMSGRDIVARAILDGPFAQPRLDFRVAGAHVQFDNTGFDYALLTGSGRLGDAPSRLTARFAARQVTGVGAVAGGILRNLSVDGPLLLMPGLLRGEALRLRSDRLQGRIMLALDLRTGRYEVGLAGALGRYLIPGLGIVDVRSTLRVVPGPNGHGTRVVGRGEATMLRFDNAFLRSLAGGLPRLATGLERTPDGILHFTDLRLVAPALQLRGSGYRRRDGSFHIEAAGRQAKYGPLTMILDGRIERPTIDLVLASPAPALGLANVRAHLDPNPGGYAVTANGGSRLGASTATGAILLPSGGQAAVDIARLTIGATTARGRLAIVPAGFDGQLAVQGGGIDGTVTLRPLDTVQQVALALSAGDARIADTTLRRGRLEATIALDPAGATIDATATGAGVRRGRLVLARFAGNLRLRGGTGTARVALSGSRGRGFDIRAEADIAPERISVAAQGMVDRRPLQLLSPAVFHRDGDGWRLAPARLSFAGGTAEIGGRYGGDALQVDATLAAMPLAILDIGYPGLGLSGVASGRFSFADTADAMPTGRAELTVRGLSRAGLVLQSRPLDVGIAAVLTADRLGIRAVMAADGRTVGRAQALLKPLGGGDLPTRLAQAPLVAQLRYQGPADTLWRLTGVELFDLSGPVAIGADVGGRLSAPAIRGIVRADGARIESATTGTVLTGVTASGQFAGSRLRIDRFAADAGKGGRVTGTGSFDFAAAHGVGLDLSLQADHAVMINRDDIGATVTGPLTFVSDGGGGRIAGNVVLNRSRYRLGQASAAAALPKLNLREINLPGGGSEDEMPATPWSLAIKAHAPGNLLVSGLGLSSEWSADLNLGGQPNNPAISGQATLIRGDYEFAGREFELQRGVIRFGGEVPANPALDIAADANTTGLNATIRVTGTALKPEIGFTSTPALPQDELLSRLLFGTSITNLSAPEALQLAAAVAALQNGGNGLNPINAVRRAAGLDRLRILPADRQTGQGTSIAAGKYVTRRLYAEIVTDGQGYSATQVEFQVTRWLSLLSSISTLGRQSANVRVSKDY
ncbi:translocation/assembly module TamB [Sphingomonas sp. MA1305]|uniref:translocation/assembly module TamB domain-containing protein n=1 Tax=Sphingomonas sp. MA1305 TaxID=2479204 RepID=UPI0018DF28E7|nr:translocation/assembly module TamB [Sphingomonas sp. MA1305]MBI0475128.1 translocation/assembly module TamB [Sphingomonas sp. MA1305]